MKRAMTSLVSSCVHTSPHIFNPLKDYPLLMGGEPLSILQGSKGRPNSYGITNWYTADRQCHVTFFT